MAINKKLIHFETLAKFQSADGINTTSATQTPTNDLVGNIPYHSIVFIKDSCKFWTHGKYYDCNNTWRGILNNLTSTSTTDSLSAYQGKILNEKFANYLPLSGGTLTGALSVPSLTVTGASTFSQAINGSILGNAATASRLLNARTITIGSKSNSFDGSGNISFTLAQIGALAAGSYKTVQTAVATVGASTNTLTFINSISQNTNGVITATTGVVRDASTSLTGVVNTTTQSFAGAKTFTGNVIIGSTSTNANLDVHGTTTLENTAFGSQLEIYRRANNAYSAIKYSGGTTKAVLGYIGITYSGDTTVGSCKPFWNDGSASYKLIWANTNSTTTVGGTTTPVYVDTTGLIKAGTALGTMAYASTANYVTIATAQIISGNKTFNGSTSIDDATIGNLVVTGGASFALTINGNAATANKVNHTLTFTGYSTGTFDGSADKSIAIPSNTNQLTNGAGFITSSSNITGTAAGITGYTFKTSTSKSTSGWTNNTTDDKIIPTMSFIAYWNGAYSGTSSNLTYCNQGAFGTATTHAHTDYVTSITYDSTNKKLQLSKGGGTATDIVTFGSNAFNSTAYLPLGGNSTSSPITGIIYIDNVSGPYINSHNTDLDVWHVVGNAGSWSSQYGFNLQYKGSDFGNNNDLILWAHNETGTHAEVYRVHQNGTFIFKSTPYVGSNTVMLSNHAANGITSTDITNWDSVYTWYTTAAGTSASGVIDNWNEIKNFIDGFHESDDLAEYLVNTFVAKTGGTMTGALTTPSLTVTGASSFSLAINGSILGNAATASRLLNARTISFMGAFTGSYSFDGSANISINTSHSHSYVNTIGISGTTITWSVNGTAQTALLLPTYTNNVTSHLRAGSSGGNANSTSDVDNPYLLLVEGSAYDSQVLLKAGTGISVSAKNGVVTITNSSPDLNHNVTSHLRVGATGATSNTSTDVSDPFLSLVEGSNLDSQVLLKADGGLSITATSGGIIKIKNTAQNSHSYTTNWEAVSANNFYPIAISPNTTPATSKNGYNADFTFNPSTKTFNNNGCRLQYDATNKVLKFLFD